MPTYEFTLVLADEITTDTADAIYAICDDATSSRSNGVEYVAFDRQAESLESAIRSAVADVQKAGCIVKHTIVESPKPVT
jgi:hypothetical protein